jgi:hypothetical protein
MRKLNIDLSFKTKKEIKKMLFQLFYDKDAALEELGLECEDPRNVVNAIIEESKKTQKNLLFGEEVPFLDTKGIDLGIKEPVVRDFVLERCYKAVFDEEVLHCIPKSAKLLKTPDDGSEENQRKLYGGLKELGFSNKEANYLKETINLHPVGLLLDKLEEAKLTDSSDEQSTVVAAEQEKISDDVISVKENPENVSNYISNKDEISDILEMSKSYGIETVDALQEKIGDLTKSLDDLKQLQEKIGKLKKSGIDFDELIKKENVILELFEIMKKF